jgi:tricarballylate dehydrogenase
MINLRGERFMDEGESFATHTYAKTGRAVLAQPGARAFEVFDQQALHLLEPRYATGEPMVSDTLEDLASHLGVPCEAFVRTVHTFNKSVNDRSFDPATLDGKATRGLEPRKSNWALPLNTPPYVAYPVSCGITFTFGGVRIDRQARVLDEHGVPIPGLHATGELTGGFFYRNYPGGAGLMRGAVFGRIAGQTAAQAALAAGRDARVAETPSAG